MKMVSSVCGHPTPNPKDQHNQEKKIRQIQNETTNAMF
jgi:hypothetical protein